MEKRQAKRVEPYWLWQTKRLFPHPLFAGLVSLACLAVSVIFAGVTIGANVWPLALGSLVFFAASAVTAAAAYSLLFGKQTSYERTRIAPQGRQPTFAVLTLLISIYSCMLTIGMHLFEAFFKNGPGTFKYYLTLGIAIAATFFTQVWGKKILKQHFVGRGTRFVLTARQSIYVIALIVGCGSYLVWLSV